MSTLKADAVTAKSTNTDCVVTGAGTGVPDIEAGFKVGGVAGVPTASIRDDAVTLAKLASGTDGELITWDASGDPAAVGVGASTNVLTSNGPGAAPTFQALAASGFTSGTATATTSGTSVTFTGIPAGTKIIIFSCEEMGQSGSDDFRFRIGDSGGIETSTYNSTSTIISGTSIIATTFGSDGFMVNVQGSSEKMNGQMILTLLNAATFMWASSHTFQAQSAKTTFGGGRKSLSAELTQVSIEGVTFDSGSVNIMYSS